MRDYISTTKDSTCDLVDPVLVFAVVVVVIIIIIIITIIIIFFKPLY